MSKQNELNVKTGTTFFYYAESEKGFFSGRCTKHGGLFQVKSEVDLITIMKELEEGLTHEMGTQMYIKSFNVIDV